MVDFTPQFPRSTFALRCRIHSFEHKIVKSDFCFYNCPIWGCILKNVHNFTSLHPPLHPPILLPPSGRMAIDHCNNDELSVVSNAKYYFYLILNVLKY